MFNKMLLKIVLMLDWKSIYIMRFGVELWYILLVDYANGTNSVVKKTKSKQKVAIKSKAWRTKMNKEDCSPGVLYEAGEWFVDLFMWTLEQFCERLGNAQILNFQVDC